MFVVVLPQPPVRGLRGRFRLLTAPRLQSERRESGGNPYLLLTVRTGRRGIPWDRVAAHCGRYGRRLVLPAPLEPPAGMGLGRFVPCSYPQQLALAAAEAVMASLPLPPAQRRIGIWDEEGKGLDCLLPLLRFCADAVVYTKAPQHWYRAAEEALSVYGVPVTVTADPAALCALPLLYAPCYSILPNGISPPAPLLAPLGAVWEKGRVFDRFLLAEAELPADPPPGIDPQLFAAALWECSGIVGRPPCPAYLGMGERQVPLQAVAEYIASSAPNGEKAHHKAVYSCE